MKKMNNKRGFTLAELLIVVAIIAVLVAISIPVFTTQLEKSKEAVDVSNMRAAYAVAMTDVLTEGYKDTTRYTAGTGDPVTYTAYYDLSGNIVKAKPTGYGKASVTGIQGSTPDWPSTGFTFDGSEKDKAVKVVITPTATVPVALSWE